MAKRAGLGRIIRPFDNMRMSRSNEVLRRWGEIKESLWIGHSDKVMKKFYAWLDDDDFSEAAGELDTSISHVANHAKPTATDGKKE